MTEADGEFVEYVTARLPDLKRLAFLLCGDDHRADDLVQETVTKLYVKWATARKADNFDRYVRAMLVRTHIDEARRPWSRVRLFGAIPDHRPAAEVPSDDRAELRAALATLPAGQRVTLILRFLYDLSVTETGELLGCSTGNVKSQTAHGLAKLRQALEARGYSMITNGG